jgi:hypothetical protein
VRSILNLEARLAVVAHVRTNHVKHALSFLRTSCVGEANHLKLSGGKALAARKIRVPPALLLLRSAHAATDQSRILATARSIGAKRFVHVVAYEALQRNLSAEMRGLLVAIGVEPSTAAAAVRPLASETADMTVKAGAENVADAIGNFEEVSHFLRPFRCLHGMLVARGPHSFPLHSCTEEVDLLRTAMRTEGNVPKDGVGVARPGEEAALVRAVKSMMAIKEERRTLRLNASEC